MCGKCPVRFPVQGIEEYFPNGGASIFTFEIKGGQEEAYRFIDHLEIFSLLANVADVKSLYSTTFFVFSAWRSRRRDRVSTPCRSRKALKGEMAAPLEHTLPHYGISTTFVDAHDLAQLEAAIRPETSRVVPWPPMNLVAECTTMSAPCSIGLIR